MMEAKLSYDVRWMEAGQSCLVGCNGGKVSS